MTLLETVLFVCQKVGQVDDYSQGICRNFVQARFRMLWDLEAWRDTQRVTTATATSQLVAFPADVQRIISIRCAGTYLDPVDATFMIETNPTLFDSTGTPKYFEDFTDPADGSRKLRLFPAPSSATPLLIVGKRPCPTLVLDNDTPQLRNIENALLAYVEGDMLARQRQRGKAALCYQEGATQVDWMRKVEAEQADHQRQNKTLSANGDTLGDYVDEISSNIKTFDPAMRIRIKQAVRRNYQAVWDAYLWRETLGQATVAALAGGIVPLPVEIERPISVRVTGTAVEALDVETLFDVDPTTFEASGVPTSFTEQRALDGTNQIVLHPAPAVGETVLILGKRKLVPLNDESERPLLRNVANALLLLAGADVAAMAPSADAAMVAAMRAQGAAAVMQMQKLQDEQSMRRRQSRALTVAGNSLAEMADAVLARCGVWDVENLILAKEYLRRDYQAMWDAKPWKESMVLARVQTDGQTLVLPEYIDRVVSIRGGDNYTLLPSNLDHTFAVDPGLFDRQPGTPYTFSILTSIATRVLPRAEKLSLSSTAATDKTPVYIRGESSGAEVGETVVLNGTATVQTSNIYDTPLTLAKGITAGSLTVTGATTGAQLLTLRPDERERKHVRLLLLGTDRDCGKTCLVLGKRKIHPLLTDQDTPMLRQAADALIHAAVGDMAARMGKMDMATDARARAASALDTLFSLETEQGANITQLVPFVEGGSGYGYGGWGDDDCSWLR